MSPDNEEAKRQEAKKRLEQLGAEAGSGVPLKIKLFILLLIAAPIIVLKVPDLESRILGVKLRYNLDENKNYSSQGSFLGNLHLKENISEAKILLDEFRLSAQSTLKSRKRDSGGNATYSLNFGQANLEFGPSLSSSDALSDEKRKAFGRSWKMNPYGGVISVFGQTVDAMRASAAARKHQQELRQKMAEFGGSYPGESDTGEDYVPPPPPKTTDFLKKDHLNLINAHTMFNYRKQRMRKGFEWNQKISWPFFSAHFDLRPREDSATFLVKGFKRSGEKFHIIIEWSGTPSGDFSWQSEDFSALMDEVLIQGEFKGTAWIDYKTGLIDQLNGQYEFMMEPVGLDVGLLFEIFPDLAGTKIDINNSTFILSGEHTFSRL